MMFYIRKILESIKSNLNISASAALILVIFFLSKAKTNPTLPVVKISNFMLVL